MILNRMKKYIKPSLMIINLEYRNIVATSQSLPETGKDDVVAGAPPKRHWGNLWE